MEENGSRRGRFGITSVIRQSAKKRRPCLFTHQFVPAPSNTVAANIRRSVPSFG